MSHAKLSKSQSYAKTSPKHPRRLNDNYYSQATPRQELLLSPAVGFKTSLPQCIVNGHR